MLVAVYTLPHCVQCEATKRMMDRLQIRYEVLNLEQHPDMVEQFSELNLMTAPVVVTDTKKWSGFRVEKIKSLANYLHNERAKQNETD